MRTLVYDACTEEENGGENILVFGTYASVRQFRQNKYTSDCVYYIINHCIIIAYIYTLIIFCNNIS